MITTIDSAGRIVVPKPLRERLALSAGQRVTIRERNGRIEIEPAPTPMTLVEGKHGLEAVPEGELPPLTDELVRETLDATRR